MPEKMNPLIFGEVLFDVFDDQSAVLGGAPFNVAWHLQGFGIDPLFISRLGQDSNGEKIRNQMQEWGMSLKGIQQDPQHPTGIVSVQTKNGENSFTINENQAYDFIESSGIEPLLRRISVDLIYHGSLALRNQISRKTLETILQKVDSPVFLDVNLRSPWWTRKNLSRILSSAHWVKCNRDELDVLANLKEPTAGNQFEKARSVIAFFDLNSIVVTLGVEGAFIMDRSGDLIQAEPTPARNLVDTVGAGDAFSAVSILGILKNWKSEIRLKRALEFASKICEIQGATLRDRDYYVNILRVWENQDEIQ